MTEKRLKDQIKEVKRYIKDVKKEIETARKCEEWGALDHLCNQLEFYNEKLVGLESQYRKE